MRLNLSLQIRRYPCRSAGPFRSARDLGCDLARCSCESAELECRSSPVAPGRLGTVTPWSSTGPVPTSPPIFLVGAESLVSGRRVKGRVAIACDAAGALDAVAATGTLTSRGRRLTPWLVVSAADEPIRSVDARSLPGAPCRVGPPGPQPGASVAGRGGAQRSRLDQIRLNSATLRYAVGGYRPVLAGRDRRPARSLARAACLSWANLSGWCRRRLSMGVTAWQRWKQTDCT